jgi:uncharacterized protein YndB with AHSA1/START domain
MSNANLPSVSFDRIFDAPPAVVFAAWTDPERLKHWIAPDGFTTPEATVDPRKGGDFSFVMRGPDGTDYPSRGTFIEFDPPSRLVMTGSIPGPDGSLVMEDLTTVTFETVEGNKTRMRVTDQITMLTGMGVEYARGMEEGWTQSLNHLEEEVGR